MPTRRPGRLILTRALSMLAIASLAIVLGGLIFFVSAFLVLPDESPIPLWIVASATGLVMVLSGALIGWLSPPNWFMAGLLSWPHLVIGLGMLPVQPATSLLWFAVLPVAVLGGFAGRRLKRTRSAKS